MPLSRERKLRIQLRVLSTSLTFLYVVPLLCLTALLSRHINQWLAFGALAFGLMFLNRVVGRVGTSLALWWFQRRRNA